MQDNYYALALQNGNWYYIRDGKLDWSYTGLDTAKDNKVYFYQNGVRKNKESIEWNGETYYFVTTRQRSGLTQC